jgi:hypothetical protein
MATNDTEDIDPKREIIQVVLAFVSLAGLICFMLFSR